jgi:CheY-like chemotaxis protein
VAPRISVILPFPSDRCMREPLLESSRHRVALPGRDPAAAPASIANRTRIPRPSAIPSAATPGSTTPMKSNSKRPISILIADDDPEDRMLAAEALKESRLANDIRFVEDGEELLDYLLQRGRFSNPDDAPRPGVILLDLNMPRKDGREALREIKENAELRRIPIIVLTTSKAEIDIYSTYDLGVNSFIVKPVTFDSLVEVMQVLRKYWFEIVEIAAE